MPPTLWTRLTWTLFRGANGARLAWRYLLRQSSLGVRGLVRDQQGQVLLVRHTYVPGWYLPGGGVHFLEPLPDALARELREEAGIEVETARLIGLYTNFRGAKSDHVALFEVTRWRAAERPSGTLEIAETGFFPPDRLPPGTTEATRRRLSEAAGEAPVTGIWSRTDPI